MNNQQFSKFLLLVIVACVVSYCVAPLISTSGWWAALPAYSRAAGILIALALILQLGHDDNPWVPRKMKVRIWKLPTATFIVGMGIAGASYLVHILTGPRDETLMVFAQSCAKSTLFMTILLFITTKYEEPKKEAIANAPASTPKFNKFLLLVTVGSLAIFCVFVPFVPFLDIRAWYLKPMLGFPGICVTSAFYMLLLVFYDKGNRVVVKTQRLPALTALILVIIAAMSFSTMLQVKAEGPVSQALQLFTIACLACAVVLPPFLWLTTEPEKKLK